jgi:hypothetical protein
VLITISPENTYLNTVSGTMALPSFPWISDGDFSQGSPADGEFLKKTL